MILHTTIIIIMWRVSDTYIFGGTKKTKRVRTKRYGTTAAAAAAAAVIVVIVPILYLTKNPYWA